MEAIWGVSWRSRAVPVGHLPERSRRRMLSSSLPPLARVAVRSESGANRMFVFGTGFVGRYVSDRLRKEGWQVSGTCTNPSSKRVLEEMGLEAFIFDVHNSKLSSLHTLQHATHLLISIPPIVGIGDPLLRLHEDLQGTLSHGNLQWLCYLSSTSVYGDCSGAWVDEDYPVNPQKESAKARLAAEKGWLALGHELGVVVNIFRLGGIYGPGRSALDTILKRESLSEGQKRRETRLYTARVHVADIHQAIKASFDILSSGKIYNVVDDDPAPRAEVFAFAEALIERRWPRMASRSACGSLEDLKSLKENIHHGEKRVSNARLKKDLGVRLLYPTYRLGLQSILDSWELFPTDRESQQHDRGWEA
ncbi:protein YeeZ isoform X2 [Phoenix dactylifera]|uniref:Protein YeeZ isoform X2 n=1 Tax=Phoenix dactylifera TaxID=42345 RepID=A0A8B7BT80_PHODC|nr:protein YeeZ isoform X2 [Phoenix dactylifera]